MSVFSRIFQKNPPRDSKRPKADPAEPNGEASQSDANHAAAPPPAAPTPSKPPRRSMRPVAPPLEMRSERPQPASPPPAPPAQEKTPAGKVMGGKRETTLLYASPAPTDPSAPPSVPRPAATNASRAPAVPAKAPAPPTPRGKLPSVPDNAKPARKPATPAAATRPAAPAPPPAHLDEIDAAFGALVDTSSNGTRDARHKSALAAPPPDVRELFVAIAANHMRPLRDVMIGLKWGDPLSSPGAICSPIVTSLMKAANEMGFAELTKGLDTFAGVLKSHAAGEGTLDTAAREAVLSAYAKLSTEMPDVFALEGEQNRREAIIVHSLLRQIPDVSHLAMQRVYAAGLANLDMMLLAEAGSIAETTGIDLGLASRIADKFQAYRRETRAAGPSAGRDQERDRLAGLAIDLRRLHENHERAASGWTDDATETKKKLRHARNEVFMQVKVVLARLGELDRLRELETTSFQGRIDRLEAYLRENGTPMNGGRG